MTEYERLIAGAAYATGGRYAHPLRFAKYIARVVDGVPDTFAHNLRQAEEELVKRGGSRPFGTAEAACVLVARDLRAVRKTVEDYPGHMLIDETSIRQVYDRLLMWYEKQGVEWRAIELFFVKDFPSPYEEAPSWAISCDISDARAYGMKPGIYLRRDWLMPFYTPFLLGHEMLHAALGQNDSDHLARGLEEGLADVIGSLWATTSVMPPEVSQVILLHSRLLRPRNQFWDLYNDGLRLALSLHELIGKNGLMEVLIDGNKRGRSVVASVDLNLIAKRWDDLRRSAPRLDEVLITFALRYRCFNDSHVVSPLAYLLGERLSLGDEVSTLLAKQEIDSTHGMEALRELQERVMLITIDGSMITAAEAPSVIASSGLRYELDINEG